MFMDHGATKDQDTAAGTNPVQSQEGEVKNYRNFEVYKTGFVLIVFTA
jgi:hypothetical protein